MGMEPPLDSPWNPDPTKKHDNPFIISWLPSPAKRARRLQNEVSDVSPEARVILFNVTECGNIIITFDGYTDYKFFRVAFESRAMVAVLKVAGHVDDIDIVPVIEDFEVVNPNVPETTEEEVNNNNDEEWGNDDVNGTSDSSDNGSDTSESSSDPLSGEDNKEEPKEENSNGEWETSEPNENNGDDDKGEDLNDNDDIDNL